MVVVPLTPSLIFLLLWLSLYNARINGEDVVVISMELKFPASLKLLLLSVTLLRGFRRSKPHVAENLYTTKNTKKLIITKTQAVTNFANKFNPDSFGSNGR